MPKASRRDILKPVELLLIAFVIALFIAFVVWMATRSAHLTLVFGGVSFVVTLMIVAMMLMAVRPEDFEQDKSGLPVLQRREAERVARRTRKHG